MPLKLQTIHETDNAFLHLQQLGVAAEYAHIRLRLPTGSASLGAIVNNSRGTSPRSGCFPTSCPLTPASLDSRTPSGLGHLSDVVPTPLAIPRPPTPLRLSSPAPLQQPGAGIVGPARARPPPTIRPHRADRPRPPGPGRRRGLARDLRPPTPRPTRVRPARGFAFPRRPQDHHRRPARGPPPHAPAASRRGRGWRGSFPRSCRGRGTGTTGSACISGGRRGR